MTFKNVSFLFFIGLFIGGFSCFLNAQSEKDSANYYYEAIINPKSSEHLPAGLNYYSQKKEIDIKYLDTLNIVKDLRMLNIGEYKLGNYYDSEEYAVEALELINKTHKGDTMINAKIGLYNQLGMIYRALNNSDYAIDALDNALIYTTNPIDSSIILNNKANIYKDLLEYSKANAIYNTLLIKAKKTKDSLKIAMALNNLGFIQTETQSPDALESLNQALTIYRKRNHLPGTYASYKNLSNYYVKLKDTGEAVYFAEEALKVAETINSSSYIHDALSVVMTLSNDPRVLNYTRLTDSLANAKQIAENKNTFSKYNIAEERKKTEANRLLQEIEKRKRLTYQGIAIFIFVLFIASYFIYRYRYKKAKIEEVYKTETRISKKVHDEVANDMYRVMNDLESTPNIGPNILDQLEEIYLKTRDISRETGAIDVQTDFENQLNDMLLGYKNEKVSVVTLNLKKIKWNGVSNLKKTGIYRVLQELMTNMKKHSQATSVALTFEKKDNTIAIKYSDNGVGCVIKKANGLQNTENRIRSLNGNISFDSSPGNGFKATILV